MCTGFFFVFGHGVSFLGGFQHPPVDGCSTASGDFDVLAVDGCSTASGDFDVLARGDECPSFYSAILNQKPQHIILYAQIII